MVRRVDCWQVKAQGAGGDVDEPEYSIRISRVRDGGMITVDATDETMLSPGDVVEVKLKRRISDSAPSLSTQAIRELDPTVIRRRGQPPRFQVSGARTVRQRRDRHW